MKTLLKLFLIVMFSILMAGCIKNDIPYPNEISPSPYHGGWLEPGKIAVIFVDSISQTHAVEILDSLNLRTYILYGFNTDSDHVAVIIVPVGEEQKWIAILLKHPTIKSARQIAVVEIT